MQQTPNRTTRRTLEALMIGLLATSMATGLAAAPRQEGGLGGGTGIEREPLVIFDVSGFGIAGPIHQHLAVYSDGLTTLSTRSFTQLSSDFTFVSPERAQELNEALLTTGALEMGDRWSSVADLPMTTLVVFNGSGAGASHNAFSFYDVGEPDAYHDLVETITFFIGEAFYDWQ